MPRRFVPADYDPAKLQVLQRAFDVAWAEVANRYSYCRERGGGTRNPRSSGSRRGK
jgi:hypothetical protein